MANANGDLVGQLETNVPAMLVCDVDLSETNDTDIRDRRPELYDAIVRSK